MKNRVRRNTLDDVARLAGVSAITVSRVLRTPELVSEKTRDKVMWAVEELDYRQNQAARTLASSSSNLIGVVVPSLVNEVFVQLLEGVQSTLEPAGYQVQIGVSHYQVDEEVRQVNQFLHQNCAGVLITENLNPQFLKDIHCPAVSLMNLDDDATIPTVGFDQQSAGYELTRHLLSQGYERIGFLAAQMDRRTLLRREGFRQALSEQDINPLRLEVLSDQPSSVGQGYLLARQFQIQNLFDAVFCCNDDLAQGVMYYCHKNQIAIPDQLAIAGFNDLSASAFLYPELTTVKTPRYEIGVKGSEILLQLIQKQKPQELHLDLGYHLQARASSVKQAFVSVER